MKTKLSIRSRVFTGALLTISLSLGTAGVAVGDTTVSSPVVEDGVYVITSAMDSNKALDVHAESKKDGANVQLWDRNDGNVQRFRVTNLGGNQYSIINEYSGKALDINGNSKKAGANVHQWTWNNSDNQRFVIEPAKNGGYTVQAVSSSLFLDVKGSRTTNGTNVIQWTGNGAKANQRWNLNPYNAPVSIETPLETQVVQLDEMIDVAASMTSVSGAGSQLEKQGKLMSAIYIGKAKGQNYTPRSGADLDWSKVVVFKYGSQWIVDVPFESGMDLVSKVLFVWNGSTVSTQEVYAQTESAEQAHVYVWNDGVAVVDTIIVDDSQDDSVFYETRGLSWKKLNNCLASFGISSWTIGVIGLVCGAACATVVACNTCFFGVAAGYGTQLGICLGRAWS